jgi:hypothetical protein
MITRNKEGLLEYQGDTFKIIMSRYSDPYRLNSARNAAIYLGKDDRDNIRRPLSIIRQGHVAEVFRGEHVEFEFVDVSKEVYDHLITYTTRNMRATGGNRALASEDYTMPSDKMKNPNDVEIAIADSMANYELLLQDGETKQVARSAMPVAAKMNPFVYQFNFLTLGQSVFKQRLWERGAQGNTVKVVQGMFELCKRMDEDLWNTFYEYMGEPTIEWGEVRKDLKKSGLTVHQLLNELMKHVHEGTEEPTTTVTDYLVKRMGKKKSMWE